MGTSFPLSSYPLVQVALTPPLILSSAFYHLGGGGGGKNAYLGWGCDRQALKHRYSVNRFGQF